MPLERRAARKARTSSSAQRPGRPLPLVLDEDLHGEAAERVAALERQVQAAGDRHVRAQLVGRSVVTSARRRCRGTEQLAEPRAAGTPTARGPDARARRACATPAERPSGGRYVSAVFHPGAAVALEKQVPVLPARPRPAHLHVHEAIGRIVLADVHAPAAAECRATPRAGRARRRRSASTIGVSSLRRRPGGRQRARFCGSAKNAKTRGRGRASQTRDSMTWSAMTGHRPRQRGLS